MVVAKLVRGPALYNLGNDQVLIWWETDIDTGPNKIDWWTTAQDPVPKAAVTTVLRDRDQNLTRYVHKVDLTGLTAGTNYFFKIFAFNFEDAFARTFTTYKDDGSSVRLGVWGNNEGNEGSTLPGLGNTLTSLASFNVDGFVSVGGIVEEGSRYQGWVEDWYDVIGTSIQTKGFSGARGDSDGFSTVSRAMLPILSPSNSYFAHSIGEARFVFLNSSFGGPRFSLKEGKEQHSWLLDQVQDPLWKNASYRVLVVHVPFRTTFWNDNCSFAEGGTNKRLLDLHDLVKLSGTDVVMYGFSRSYQRGAYESLYQDNPHQITHIVTGGGGGFKHNNRCYTWDPPTDPGIVKDTSDYVVLTMDVSSSKLLIEAHNLETNEVFDTVSIAPHTLH